MSFCEKLLENGQKSFLRLGKNSSKRKVLHSESSTSSGPQVVDDSIRSESNPSAFTAAPKTCSSQAEESTTHRIVGWRRATAEDVPAIRKLEGLTGDIAHLLYRISNIKELVGKSFAPIVQYDSKGDLVSFTAFDTFPNLPSVNQFWEESLKLNYRFDDITPRTALFIHYMLWTPEQRNKFLPLLLESLFSQFIFVKHIIIIKPPNAFVPDFYKKYFIPILPPSLKEISYESMQTILMCLKTSIVRSPPIRSAFDYELGFIVSIIEEHFCTTDQRTRCGLDFVNFIYQKDRKTLICEFEGQLAGIMVLNLKIDLDLLNEGFELAPFNGLRKKNFLDQTPVADSPNNAKLSASKIQECPNLLISSEFLFSQLNWEILLTKLKTTEPSGVSTNDSSSSSTSEAEFSNVSSVSLSFTENSAAKNDETGNEQAGNQAQKDCLSKTAQDVKVAFRTSGIAMTHFFSPKYHGQSNAFVIDFFAVDCNKIDEKLSAFDFLEAAFKKVPDRDYCVLIIPTDFLPFPLLDLFVRVTPRPMSTYKQELYLCHKKSLSVVSMSVRSTEEGDLADINYFLRHVYEGGTVYKDILHNCFIQNNNFKSFVLTAGKKIVGVSLINCLDSSKYFRKYFHVPDLTSVELNKNDGGSVIKHFIINPKYYQHTRFFLWDIMRLIETPCLFYVNKKSYKENRNVVTVLGDFYPIKPKKQAGLDKLFSEARLPFLEEKPCDEFFGLYFINHGLCGIRKIHRNIVIVVVGACRTSLAFLDSLIFGHSINLRYNNLICVTPHGPEIEVDQPDLDLMFPTRDNFSRKYSSRLSLDTYVNFIYGVMTEIKRSEKYIVVNNKDIVKYDYLILTCGLQYLSPTPKNKATFTNTCNKNFRSPLARFLIPPLEQKKIYAPKHPNNLFVINTHLDAQNAIRSVRNLLTKVKRAQQTSKKIIVYGHNLHVFLTIHTLLKIGIPGEFIVFVEPFPTNTTSFTLFNDYCVDQAVLETVKACKVNYYTEYFLYDWALNSDDFITSITFHSHRKQVVIPCLAFFPFLEKLVSDVTFNACNDAGLVYDGRLVINHNFRTNDSYIYAAGPFTKYAKRYFASGRNHQYYNSTEVGQKLAEIIREQINPKSRANEEKGSDLVPVLKAPILLYCQLPGDFNLFTIRKPGKELDLETAYNFVNYGEVLTTGDCQMKAGFGYFRLHLDSEGFVQSITCYTKDKIDYLNLSCLYGLHEKILNNLLLRYDMSMIPDFFAYFRQPWALALFHEHFHVLRDKNMMSFNLSMPKGGESFAKTVVRKLKLKDWKSLSRGDKKELEEKYSCSLLEDGIKNNVLEFLEYYKEDFPTYTSSDLVKKLKYENGKFC